jgi:hypothetical protein
VDPSSPQATEVPVRKKQASKEKGGIEEWFVNTRGDLPGIDDS